MFDLCGVFTLLLGLYSFVDELFTVPISKSKHFDTDGYIKDIKNGMTSKEQFHKRRSGRYWVE